MGGYKDRAVARTHPVATIGLSESADGGADPNAKNSKGKTALEECQGQIFPEGPPDAYTELVNLLIDAE